MIIIALVLSIIALLIAIFTSVMAIGSSALITDLKKHCEMMSSYGNHHFSEMDKRLSILEQKAKIRIIKE